MSFSTVVAIAGTLFVLVELFLRLFALGVIPGNRRPTSGMAWLLLILIEPIIGFAIFWMFGRTALGKKRHARQVQAHQAIAAAREGKGHAVAESLSPQMLTVTHLNTNLGATPPGEGNSSELLPIYEDTITVMAAAVAGARTYVHVEFYIMAWDELTDPFFRALIAATERGVRISLLFDHLGSHGIPGYPDMLKKLNDTKIDWHSMLPIQPLKGKWRRPDLRNHRKLMVVDGLVGFTGSLNLTERGYNKPKNHKVGRQWVELMVKIEGPIVHDLDTVFATDWYTETGVVPEIAPATAPLPDGMVAQVVPSGPGYVAENNLRLFTTLLYTATRRISLTSPYFVPDESLLYAVTTAAQRGIEIELFVSEVSDQFMVGHAQASYYQALLEAGVRIYRYPAPYILHSKHFTIDDDIAVIGSSNMDMRSFALNFEISLMMLGEDIVTRMREVEDTYRLLSSELTLEAWRERSAGSKYVDNVMRLTAALQ